MEKVKDAASIARALHDRYDNAALLNRLLRQRIPRRGSRFDHDTQDTFMYIERSKNRNVVAYSANLVDAGTRESVASGEGRSCVLDASNPVHAYFIVLEPSLIEERRKRGATSEMSDLTFIQRKLAYGCSAKPFTPAKDIAQWMKGFDPYAVSYVALPHEPLLLLVLPPLEGEYNNNNNAEAVGGDDSHHAPTDGTQEKGKGKKEPDTMVVLLGVLGGVLSVIHRVYVCSVEPKHFYQLPSVKYIEVFGVSVETGSDTYEKTK